MWPTAATAPASTIRRIAALGSQGDHSDRLVPGVENATQFARLGISQQRGVVGTAALGGQPRTLQVDAGQ